MRLIPDLDLQGKIVIQQAVPWHAKPSTCNAVYLTYRYAPVHFDLQCFEMNIYNHYGHRSKTALDLKLCHYDQQYWTEAVQRASLKSVETIFFFGWLKAQEAILKPATKVSYFVCLTNV